MILSNLELQRALDEGRIVIDPEPQPRRPIAGAKCPYNTHSVDLTLGNEISIPIPGNYICDLRRSENQSLAEFQARNSNRVLISGDSPHIFKRNHFILARTRERVDLKIPSVGDVCLAARIEGKSSWARVGLLVHFTAPTVHPGFAGTLTLEMINLGPADIVLAPDIPIAQLIVEEVRGIPFSNPSQFQGQSSPEGVLNRIRDLPKT